MSGVFNVSRLAGKVVLITGASSGIGKDTAILFARAGCSLILTARRLEQLQEVKSLAEKANKEGGTGKGGEVAIVQLDLQDRQSVAKVMEKVPESLKAVDILVNNAGMVFGREQVGDIAEADIEVMFNTNVLGMITMTQTILNEVFKKRNAGHIINLGSIAGREPYAGGAIYCATKAALRSFTSSLLREQVGTPIRVTEIQPGMVETEFSIVRFRGDKQAADKVYEGITSLPLSGHDIAEEIVWAASRPDHVNIAEVLIFPACQAPGVVSKK